MSSTKLFVFFLLLISAMGLQSLILSSKVPSPVSTNKVSHTHKIKHTCRSPRRTCNTDTGTKQSNSLWWVLGSGALCGPQASTASTSPRDRPEVSEPAGTGRRALVRVPPPRPAQPCVPEPRPERGSPGAPPAAAPAARTFPTHKMAGEEGGRRGAGARPAPGRGTAGPGTAASAGRSRHSAAGAELRGKRGKAGGHPSRPVLPALTISRKMTAPE